jgi:hypothetical protein
MPPHPVSRHLVSRRHALRLGGLTAAVAALAACGVEEDADPGRVGVVTPTTALPDYPVDDAVLLRTATSLEITIIDLYEEILARGELSAAATELMNRLIEDHQVTVGELQAQTIGAGGEPWECGNPWMLDRVVVPVIESIDRSVQIEQNVIDFAVALENLAAANNQSLAASMTTAEQRTTLAVASAQAARNAATITIRQRGSDGYVDPAPNGDPVFAEDGARLNFAVPSVFGSLAAIELVIVAPDVDGGPEDFSLQLPAENSYIYNELEPTC